MHHSILNAIGNTPLVEIKRLNPNPKVRILAKIEYVNPAFTKISGYTYEEALGHKPGILKSGKHTKEFYKNLWGTILAGKTWKGDIINKKKSG